MTDLLPCPFCGGEAKVNKWEGGFKVLCQKVFCAVLGPFNSEAEAIEAWNTRAERTCRITSEEYDDLLDMFTTHFSCGHYGIGMARWFKHCPECGAKVVTE